MKVLKDVSLWTCLPDTSLQDIMRLFNEIEQPFMIVVDTNYRPIGTITDGDIRRGILAGVTIEASAINVMNHNPQVARRENDSEIKALLETVEFVPVIDDGGKLVEIWLTRTDDRRRPAVLIMAGGLGKRLGRRTENTPKPLLSVGGKPILAHVLDWLERHRYDTIFISTHHLSAQIEDFIAERAGPAPPEMLHETEMLGTAGAMHFGML